MAYRFEFDAGNGVLLARFTGRVSNQEFEEFYGSVPQYVEATKPRSAIADFCGVSNFDVTGGKLRRLAQAKPALRDASIPRVIVAPTPAIYEMARMFYMLGKETRPLFSIVRTLEEAYKELKVQKPRFEVVAPLNSK